jgi:hypothetical protein
MDQQEALFSLLLGRERNKKKVPASYSSLMVRSMNSEGV